jgi:hypothetical protein
VTVCRRQLEGLRQTVTMLRGLPAERMPRPVTIPVRRLGGWQWRSALVPAAGMAAAVTLALGGFFAGQYSRGPSAASRSAQTSQYLENRGSAGGVTAPQSLRDQSGAMSKARVPAQLAMTVETDRPVYSAQDTITITVRTTGTSAPAAIQFDRNGYRVRVPGAFTPSGETRATLKLATLDPPVSAGTYRVIATVALDASGDTVLVAETSILVQ